MVFNVSFWKNLTCKSKYLIKSVTRDTISTDKKTIFFFMCEIIFYWQVEVDSTKYISYQFSWVYICEFIL